VFHSSSKNFAVIETIFILELLVAHTKKLFYCRCYKCWCVLVNTEKRSEVRHEVLKSQINYDKTVSQGSR